MKVTINKKEFDLEGTYGLFQELTKKYPDMKDIMEWRVAKYDDLIFTSIWKMLPRKWGIFKPFISKKSMINKLRMSEMNNLRTIISEVVLGREKEGEGDKDLPE